MTERPNVIVVFTDQQRADTTGVSGNPVGLTPNFDRMARAGTHLAQAFTPNPVCAPARSALQTGCYPTANDVHRNGRVLDAGKRTVAHDFADAGYHTGYIGKWHLGSRDPVPESERGGYTEWLAANTLEFTSDEYHTVMYDEQGQPVRMPGYRSDACFDAAIRFVERNSLDRDQPFYLFLSLLEPHHQNEVDAYPAPEGYEQYYQGAWMPPDLAALSAAGAGTAYRHMAGYLGQIKRVDEGLGRLRDALYSLGLSDSTVLAFTSDHGNHFKTRNGEYKRSCHDSSIRVPFALSGPGFDGGGTVDRPLSTVDLPPTLLEAAGIPGAQRMHGRSLLRLLRGDIDGPPDDVLVQVSEHECGRVLRTDRWKYYVVDPDADPWEDPSSTSYQEAALYDLKYDPHELDNLVGSPPHRSVADELAERLCRRLAEVEQAPSITPAPSRAANARKADPTVREIWSDG